MSHSSGNNSGEGSSSAGGSSSSTQTVQSLRDLWILKKAEWQKASETKKTLWSDARFFNDFAPKKLYKTPSSVEICSAMKHMTCLLTNPRTKIDGMYRSMFVLIMTCPTGKTTTLGESLMDKDTITGAELPFKAVSNLSDLKFDASTYYVLDSGERGKSNGPSESSGPFNLIEQQAEREANVEKATASTSDPGLSLAQSFWKEMGDLVEQEDAKVNNWVTTPSSLTHRAVMGFMCLYLMRLFTKSPDNVVRAFSERFSSSFNSLFGPFIDPITVFGPNALRVSLLANVIRKECSEAKTLLGIIITMAWYNDRLSSNEVARAATKAGCLVYLSEYGMPLIKLFNQVLLAFDKSPTETLDIVNTTLTVSSVSCIKDHLIAIEESTTIEKVPTIYKAWITQATDATQYTWPWARLFDQNTFKNFHKQYNIVLLARFATILKQMDPNSTVETMTLFAGSSAWLDSQREFAKHTCAKYTNTLKKKIQKY